ncbi:MAG: hypothetical protein RLY43_2559, partial [Bacteroidota bacterium]
MKTSDFITHYNNNSKIFKNICTKCSDLLRSDIGKETY